MGKEHSKMGIEFTSKFDEAISASDSEAVLRNILASPNYKLVKQEGTELRLRFTDPQEQSTWAEDIEIELSPREVYVLFHFGSKNAMNQLLELIQSSLASRKIACDFQEE